HQRRPRSPCTWTSHPSAEVWEVHEPPRRCMCSCRAAAPGRTPSLAAPESGPEDPRRRRAGRAGSASGGGGGGRRLDLERGGERVVDVLQPYELEVVAHGLGDFLEILAVAVGQH